MKEPVASSVKYYISMKMPPFLTERQSIATYRLIGALSGALFLSTFMFVARLLLRISVSDAREYVVLAILGGFGGGVTASLFYRQAETGQVFGHTFTGYRNLFEDVPVGSCEVSATGSILLANSAALRILCYPDLATLLATHLDDLLVDLSAQQLLTLGQTGTAPVAQDVRVRAFDGTQRWVRFQTNQAQTNPQTRVFNLVDITPQKHFEELLKLRQAVLAAQDVIFMTDREGVFTFINPAFTAVYGYTADQVLSRVTPRILKSGQMTPDDYEALWQKMLSKQSFSGELVNKTRDGRYVTVEASANPILGEEEQIIGFLAIQRDVSEHKQALEALQRHSHRLEIMRNIDHAILRENSPDTIAAAALQAIEGFIPFLRISVTLFDFTVNEFVILAARAHGESLLSAGRRGKLEEFGTDPNLLCQNRTYMVEDIDQLGKLTTITAQLKREGVRSFINIPLMIKDELIGSLNLANDISHGYSTEEINTVQDVAAQVALAIHQSQLREDNERQRQELITLLKVSQELATTIKLNHVLQLVIDQGVSTMRLDTGAVYTLDGDKLYLGATTPPLPRDMPEELRVAQLCNHPHINEAIATGTPVFLPDTTLADLTAEEQEVVAARGLRSLLYIPLPVGERMIGVLIVGTVGRTQTFSVEELRLCQTLSVQMALAVENARLHDQLQRHAEELELTVARRTQELQTANRHLEALSRVKDEFVSNVSHELRTPITSLKLQEYLLEKRPDQLVEHLAVIKRDTDRLAWIIEDLLQLSCLDQRQMALDRYPVDLNLLVHQLALDRVLLAEENGLTLSVELTEGATTVQADERLLIQVLSVLLTNAVNYTPHGGSVTVTTQTSLFDGQIWAGFSVADTGPGIPPEDIPLLFERFLRGKAGRDSGKAGTGLGLALAKEIVDRHQGRIVVESTGVPGEGTRFEVWIPTHGSHTVSAQQQKAIDL